MPKIAAKDLPLPYLIDRYGLTIPLDDVESWQLGETNV